MTNYNPNTAKILELGAQGLGCKRIGKILGMDHSVVYRIRKKNGVKMQRCESKPKMEKTFRWPFSMTLEFQKESSRIKSMDELKHWGNHPEVKHHWRRKYQNNLKTRNPNYFLSTRIRSRVSNVLAGRKKSAPTLTLLGCTLPELRQHLQSQFKHGMTWDNYGSSWHIDHIRPCSSFDLIDPEQQRACFHFTNLQPLRAEDNWSKHARIIISQPQLLLTSQN